MALAQMCPDMDIPYRQDTQHLQNEPRSALHAQPTGHDSVAPCINHSTRGMLQALHFEMMTPFSGVSIHWRARLPSFDKKARVVTVIRW